MAVTRIAFFFALGASAEVPHWVEQKPPRFNVPTLDKIMAPMHSLQIKLAKQTPNTRRLLAIVSDECAAACPGVGDLLSFMMTTSTASTTAPPEGTLSGEMMALCDYADTVVCVSTTAACKDPVPEGSEPTEEEDTSMMKCACACPSVGKASDPQKMCPEKDAIVGCLTGQSSCKSIVKSMGGPRAADIACRELELECEQKGLNLGKEIGTEKMITFGVKCSEATKEGKLADHKVECCPILKDVMGVYPKECIHLGWETQKIAAENGDEAQKKEMEANLEWGKVCTDSGLATSTDQLGASTASADSSESVGVSLLTMVSAMVALIA